MSQKLNAQTYFESIEGLMARIAKLDAEIESAYAQAGPRGQQLGSVGGSGSAHDAMAAVDHIIDSDAVAERDRLDGLLRSHLDYAADVLYGRSGRGGLANATCTDDADVLCFHYLQGESWASIGKRYDVESSNLTVWAKTRARRAFRAIDRIGMDTLADS